MRVDWSIDQFPLKTPELTFGYRICRNRNSYQLSSSYIINYIKDYILFSFILKLRVNVSWLRLLFELIWFSRIKCDWFKVIFDTDPAPRGSKSGSAKSHEIMSQAMIRGMQDEDNDQFVAYFLPECDFKSPYLTFKRKYFANV